MAGDWPERRDVLSLLGGSAVSWAGINHHPLVVLHALTFQFRSSDDSYRAINQRALLILHCSHQSVGDTILWDFCGKLFEAFGRR
jgi:hypothetical protein